LPKATPFTSVAVASDLFGIVLTVASDEDRDTQRRQDEIDLRAFNSRQQGGFFYDSSDASSGDAPPPRAFSPSTMRILSSKHCQVAGGGGDGGTAPSGVSYSPVELFQRGRVAARFACQAFATLRPNPASVDGNGLLKLHVQNQVSGEW
jgi:hypothetical protein